MDLKDKKFHVIIIIALLSITLLTLNFILPGGITGKFIGSGMGREKAINLTKSVLKLANDQAVKVSAVEKTGSLWKVIVKGESGMREFYLTSEGRFLISNPIEIQPYIENTKKAKNFVECMDEEGLKFYGNNNNATIMQLRIMGATQFINDIFYPLNNQTKSYLVKNGVKELPAFEIDGNFYQGIKQIEWFEEKTGCKYDE